MPMPVELSVHGPKYETRTPKSTVRRGLSFQESWT